MLRMERFHSDTCSNNTGTVDLSLFDGGCSGQVGNGNVNLSFFGGFCRFGYFQTQILTSRPAFMLPGDYSEP